MSVLSSLNNLLYDACIIFRKSVDNFEIAHKHANFKLGVQYTLCHLNANFIVFGRSTIQVTVRYMYVTMVLKNNYTTFSIHMHLSISTNIRNLRMKLVIIIFGDFFYFENLNLDIQLTLHTPCTYKVFIKRCYNHDGSAEKKKHRL